MPSRALALGASALGQSAGQFSKALFGLDEKRERQEQDRLRTAEATRRTDLIEQGNVDDRTYRADVLQGQQDDRALTADYRATMLQNAETERLATAGHRANILTEESAARRERAQSELRAYFKSVGWVPPDMRPEELGMPPGADMGAFSQALKTSHETENAGTGTARGVPSLSQISDLYTTEQPVMNDLGEGMVVSSGETTERTLMDPSTIMAKRDSMIAGQTPTWPSVVDNELVYPELAPPVAPDSFSAGVQGGPPTAQAAPPAGQLPADWPIDTGMNAPPPTPPPTMLEQAQADTSTGMSFDSGVTGDPFAQEKTDLRGVPPDRARSMLMNNGYTEDEIAQILGG